MKARDRGDVRTFDIAGEEYPAVLREIKLPPERLWVRGHRLDRMPPAVAVVGARAPTPYGEQIAEDLAADLAVAGFCVVSGLARGCDGAAHRGALRAGGLTLAVLGTGIDVVHPRNHRRLAEAVAANGALLTEFPPGTPGWPGNFVRRNRIIAGLSHAVVVVQAARGSGALITARLAGEQGRSVLAVPGNIDVEGSVGPHDLIRDGAKLCAGAGDVVRELEAVPCGTAIARQRSRARVEQVEGLAAPERALLDVMSGTPRPLQWLATKAGLPGPEAAGALVRLEMAGLAVPAAKGGWMRAR